MGVSQDEHGTQPVQGTEGQHGTLPSCAVLSVPSECGRGLGMQGSFGCVPMQRAKTYAL